MASNKKKQEKQDDKLIQILRVQTQQPGNKQCFDCGQRGPTYVNTTIGTFVCTKCSGMLRGLTPPHRVKSISMATFTPEEVEFIKNRGNDFSRKIWLALYDETIEQNTRNEQSTQDFMVAKYEKRRYYMEPGGSSMQSRPPVRDEHHVTKSVVNSDSWQRPEAVTTWQKKHPGQTASAMLVSVDLNESTNPMSVPHPAAKPPHIPHIQPPTMSLTATTNMFTPDRPDTFKFPPVVNDAFGIPAAAAPAASAAQPFFADFDNNPAFDLPPAAPMTVSTSFPSALRAPSEDKYAALKDLDSMMKMQQEAEVPAKTNGNEWGPHTGLNGSLPQQIGINTSNSYHGGLNSNASAGLSSSFNGGFNSSNSFNSALNGSNPQAAYNYSSSFNNSNPFSEFVGSSPPAAFNPFRSSNDSPSFSIPSSHSMPFPVSWNNANNLAVGPGSSGNPFL